MGYQVQVWGFWIRKARRFARWWDVFHGSELWLRNAILAFDKMTDAGRHLQFVRTKFSGPIDLVPIGPMHGPLAKRKRRPTLKIAKERSDDE